MENINLIKDSSGNAAYIAIPFDFFNQFFPDDFSNHSISEFFEDMSMNNAIDEAKRSELLSLDEAKQFLAELEC
jgi:hypothetical protein